jgi:hypothetical protein
VHFFSHAVSVLQTLESQLAGEQGSKLDVYEMEVANERGDALQDLAEFNLAVVSEAWGFCSGVVTNQG